MHRGRYLARLFQEIDFFLSRPVTGHSHIISAQPNLVTFSSVLLVPLAFSPCPNANGGIDPLAICLLECSSLQLHRGN